MHICVEFTLFLQFYKYCNENRQLICYNKINKCIYTKKKHNKNKTGEKMDKEYYMGVAIEEAKKAYNMEEVPIGCVIVYNGSIIGRGSNSRISDKNPLMHAEIKAINEACAVVGDWRLEGCTLFVTVEPCPMCSGAILQARIDEVVFGASNPKAGCCGSILNMMDDDRFNHKVKVTKNVRQAECAELMKSFFRKRRELQ